MLLNVIRTEMIKLRRAPVWIAFLVLPVLSAVMGSFNYIQNIGILKKAWFSLWTQHTLFSSFFFLPALLGVTAAYQWRLEHRENNWNSLMCYPVPVWQTVLGKLTVNAGMTALTLAFSGALYYVSGRLAGLRGAPPEQLPAWLGLGVLGGVCVGSVQLYLSMRIKSFALPVAVSLVGGIAGLIVANYGYGTWFPYSLLAIGMDANGREDLATGGLAFFLISCLVYTGLFFLLSVRSLKKRDIETR